MNELKENEIFSQKYTIKSSNLSRRPSVYIYNVFNEVDQRSELLKIDFENLNKVKNEYNILSKLQSFQGFPKTYDSNFVTEPYYFTQESYNSDLNSKIKKFKKFDLFTSVSVFVQLITALEILH
jgi:hypothetical protein